MTKSFVDSLADSICAQSPSSPVDVVAALMVEVAKRQRLAAVRDFARGTSPAYVSRADQIIAETCRAFAVTTEELMGPLHTRRLVRPRHVSWHLLNTELDMSRAEIGRMFDRNHTTVTFGLDRIRSKPEAMRVAGEISARLREGWSVGQAEAAE